MAWHRWDDFSSTSALNGNPLPSQRIHRPISTAGGEVGDGHAMVAALPAAPVVT